MRTVDPSADAVHAFAGEAVDARPVVMLNLLRFRDLADYGAAPPPGARPGATGRQAYQRYSRGVMPLLWEVGGQVLWMGQARGHLIAPGGERWDEVLLVYYPARRAFVSMVTSAAYERVRPHRTAALLDSRLVETRAVRLPRWILGGARLAVRARALVAPRVR